MRVRVKVRVRLGLVSSRCHRISSTSSAAIVSIAILVVSTATASIAKASIAKASIAMVSTGMVSTAMVSIACLLAHPAQLRLARGLGHHSHLVGTAHKSKHSSACSQYS